MEVRLSADLENKLSRIAAQEGREAEALVREAVQRLLDYDEWFAAEVEKGLAQVERGQTFSHEEMGVRLSTHLASKHSKA